MGYQTMPRVRLAKLPTPLEEMKRLRALIGGPRLFIKRDDLTGMGGGGNKVRKLEFQLGEAVASGCDTVVTSGDVQTNLGRLTAAACARLGLQCVLVMTGKDCGYYEGNRILDRLFHARQVFAEFDDSVPADQLDKEKLRAGDQKIKEVMARLRRIGRKPYLIPRGGRCLQGTAGNAAGLAELNFQLAEKGIDPDHILVPGATCSSMTGILLGCKICTLKARVHGIALSRTSEEGKRMVMEEFNQDAEAMGYPFRIQETDVDIWGEYIGQGYGKITEKAKEAMYLLASTEGIVLDPVYTGKAFSGYIDKVRHHFFKDTETVIFYHTGGFPLVFLNSVGRWIQEDVDRQIKNGVYDGGMP